MNLRTLVAIIVSISIVQSCRNTAIEDRYSFNAPTIKRINIETRWVQLDSLNLDNISMSSVGEISFQNTNIYFIDEKFAFVSKFDTSGKFKGRYIGQGSGPNELPISTITFFSPLPDGGFFFIGPSWDCFRFNSSFKRVDDYSVNWNSKASKKEMGKHPDPADTKVYSFAYGACPMRTDGDNLYLPIISQHPLFNPLSESYPGNARILASMYIKNGSVTRIFGRLSPIYSKNKNVSTFSYASFDLLPGNRLAMSYPADSLIYLFDNNFDLLEIFGSSGRNMDLNYHSATSLKDFRNNWHSETENRGYYRSMKFIDVRNLLFRSYQKGGKEISDGLQIYKGDTLVADLDVPKGFSVEGYIAPYFYSNAFINDEKGTIRLYRFKLH